MFYSFQYTTYTPPWLSFTSLIKFIPIYFILFDITVNGIVLNSFLDCKCIEAQFLCDHHFLCVVTAPNIPDMDQKGSSVARFGWF